jgi:hypothetical protein
MSAVIYALRPIQSAKKFKDKPNLYQCIVRAICADQRAGLSGFAVLHQARMALGSAPKERA